MADSTFKGKRILITGSSGYIATSLIQQLTRTDCHIVPLSRATGDIRDAAIWEKALVKTDFVFHFAAQTSVLIAEKDPPADFEINVLPVLQMLETCRQRGFHPVVLLAGTATEVGLPAVSRVEESTPDVPVTIYDLHKLMAENYLKYYVRHRVVQGCCLRLFNVYGPGPESSSGSRGILNQMVRKALRGEDLTLYGKGDVVRDYIFIDDVVQAFIKAAEHIDRTNGRHFNIGTGTGVKLAEAFNLVAERCGHKTGKAITVRPVDPPPGSFAIEERNYVADSRRFTEATGWIPAAPLKEGIDRTIEFCLNQYVS